MLWSHGVSPAGALFSGLATGFLENKIGRKWTMLLMAIPFLSGWIILTLTKPLGLGNDGPEWFYVGRALAG